MRKLLIADSNEDFLLALAEALQGSCQILCCRSGNQALSLLREERPDILILDLMLPELDGLTLLERAAREGILPTVLASTPLLTDYVLDSAQRLGISYLMRKPCDVQAMADRALDLGQVSQPTAQAPDPREFLLEKLRAFRISTKHKGYRYLPDAITLLAKAPDMPVTKELYPAVAKLHGCQPEHIERAIRTALEAAWDRGDPKLWQQYFPGTTCRPSNAVFLSRMAEELRHLTE